MKRLNLFVLTIISLFFILTALSTTWASETGTGFKFTDGVEFKEAIESQEIRASLTISNGQAILSTEDVNYITPGAKFIIKDCKGKELGIAEYKGTKAERAKIKSYNPFECAELTDVKVATSDSVEQVSSEDSLENSNLDSNIKYTVKLKARNSSYAPSFNFSEEADRLFTAEEVEMLKEFLGPVHGENSIAQTIGWKGLSISQITDLILRCLDSWKKSAKLPSDIIEEEKVQEVKCGSSLWYQWGQWGMLGAGFNLLYPQYTTASSLSFPGFSFVSSFNANPINSFNFTKSLANNYTMTFSSALATNIIPTYNLNYLNNYSLPSNFDFKPTVIQTPLTFNAGTYNFMTNNSLNNYNNFDFGSLHNFNSTFNQSQGFNSFDNFYNNFGNTGFGNTGFGNTGFGNTGFGNTGFGNTGFGNTGFGSTWWNSN